LRIALAQISPVVGDFEGNVRKIAEAYERACQAQARLLLTPELGLCGYPPHDLIERPEMFDRNDQALNQLAELTRGKSCALVVGHVGRNPADVGPAAQNRASVLEGGKVVFSQAKSLLPTYDVFDEARYFAPAAEIVPWTCDGVKIGLGICEDLWGNDPAQARQLYQADPIKCFLDQGIQVLVSISASPYEWGKSARREKLHGQIAKELQVPLLYVNQVGANDEILFDGGSFVLGTDGQVTGRLPFFKTGFAVVDVPLKGAVSWNTPSPADREDQAPAEIEVMARGLIVGIRDYFQRTGFKTAILGLSGGIDSAVVAVLTAKAIGAENVLGVAMPSQYSSSHSLEDAEALARNLGLRFEVRPIKFLFSAASRELGEARGGQLAPLALENLQSRLRALTVMTLSNHYNALVLTTGNKSEIATGYCTLYGDMVGALAPIGDIYKTRVYELARFLNKILGSPIPESSLVKPPSAELRPNQTDQDTLPPYEALDALLEDYLEKGRSLGDLRSLYSDRQGTKPGWIEDVLRRLEMNEYKRRQGAPVLKVSRKAFGIGRRIPIAKRWG